jgi:hypothetical protein
MDKKKSVYVNIRLFVMLILIVIVVILAFIYSGGFGTSDRSNTEIIIEKGNSIVNYPCLTDNDCSSLGADYYCAKGNCYYYKTEDNKGKINQKKTQLKQLGFFIDFAAGPVVDGAIKSIYYNEGYVGIGTATPQNTLNVKGDANITGTTYGTFSGNFSGTATNALACSGDDICEANGFMTNYGYLLTSTNQQTTMKMDNDAVDIWMRENSDSWQLHITPGIIELGEGSIAGYFPNSHRKFKLWDITGANQYGLGFGASDDSTDIDVLMYRASAGIMGFNNSVQVNGTITSTRLAGNYGGSAYVCVWNNGTLYASISGCRI